MTLNEYRAHYSAWSILASPLIHGCDLRTVRQEHPECFELISNPEIVKVNQVRGLFYCYPGGCQSECQQSLRCDLSRIRQGYPQGWCIKCHHFLTQTLARSQSRCSHVLCQGTGLLCCC